MKPTIGRIVIYRTDGRNGLVYDLPAIITCTEGTHPGNYPDGQHNPLPVPLGDEVHLTVFTPGGVGAKVGSPARDPETSADFVGESVLVPGSGTYVELSVPQYVEFVGDPAEPFPRTWRWPERVA